MKYLERIPNWAYLCAVALVVVTLNSGCDSSGVFDTPDEQEISPTHSSPAINMPAIVDDRMYFKDFDDFGEYISGIAHADSLSIDYLPSPPGFLSLLEDTEQLMLSLEDESEADQSGLEALDMYEIEIVEDPYFASVLNKDGEIQIGDDVFKITRNYAYRVSVADAGFLKSVSLRQPDHSALLELQDGSFEVHEIERSARIYGALESGKTMGSSTCKRDFVRKRRLSGKSWVTDYWLYASAGTESVSERKAGIRGWVNNRIERVAFTATYNVEDSHGSTTSGSETKVVQNGHTARSVFAQDWGGRATMTGSVDSSHDGERASVSRECSTSIYRAG
jgi:hypothetical protein